MVKNKIQITSINTKKIRAWMKSYLRICYASNKAKKQKPHLWVNSSKQHCQKWMIMLILHEPIVNLITAQLGKIISAQLALAALVFKNALIAAMASSSTKKAATSTLSSQISWKDSTCVKSSAP
jgi:hypothetical protein